MYTQSSREITAAEYTWLTEQKKLFVQGRPSRFHHESILVSLMFGAALTIWATGPILNGMELNAIILHMKLLAFYLIGIVLLGWGLVAGLRGMSSHFRRYEGDYAKFLAKVQHFDEALADNQVQVHTFATSRVIQVEAHEWDDWAFDLGDDSVYISAAWPPYCWRGDFAEVQLPNSATLSSAKWPSTEFGLATTRTGNFFLSAWIGGRELIPLKDFENSGGLSSISSNFLKIPPGQTFITFVESLLPPP